MNFHLQLVVGAKHVIVLKNQCIQYDGLKYNKIEAEYGRDAMY